MVEKNFFIKKADKILRKIVGILTIALCISIFLGLIYLISQIMDFLKYHSNYVIIAVIISILCFYHFKFLEGNSIRIRNLSQENTKYRLIISVSLIMMIPFIIYFY